MEKKRAWPKVQFGSLVAFFKAEIPCALAFSTSEMKSSNSSSANRERKKEREKKEEKTHLRNKQHVFRWHETISQIYSNVGQSIKIGCEEEKVEKSSSCEKCVCNEHITCK